MDGYLVFELVRTVVLQPRYRERVQSDAHRLRFLLDRITQTFGLCTEPEPHLCGYMQTISLLSEAILKTYGYATRWYLPSDPEFRYYPLRIQALDLRHPRHEWEYEPRERNPLGGLRAW